MAESPGSAFAPCLSGLPKILLTKSTVSEDRELKTDGCAELRGTLRKKARRSRDKTSVLNPISSVFWLTALFPKHSQDYSFFELDRAPSWTYPAVHATPVSPVFASFLLLLS